MTQDNTNKPADPLFEIAEKVAADFSLFPEYEDNAVDYKVKGLLTPGQCNTELEKLNKLTIDEYIERVVEPSEKSLRTSAKEIVKALTVRCITEHENGPLYCTEAEINFEGHIRRVGFICQNREHSNGAWSPEHHDQATEKASQYASMALPIITLIDTPGADAGEQANSNNQAHSISRLITEMVNCSVPTVGVILGAG